MLEINMIYPKTQPIPFCPGTYILPLWKQAKTHFMTLVLKKRVPATFDRYKLSLVFVNDKEN